MGFRPIAIDGGEEKKKLCLSMGAEEFIDFREVSDVPKRVVEVTDGVGAHGVIVTAYQAYKGNCALPTRSDECCTDKLQTH